MQIKKFETNSAIKDVYCIHQFIPIKQQKVNSEFTANELVNESYLNLKYQIFKRNKTICKNYNLDCDSTYIYEIINENYKYPININIEF